MKKATKYLFAILALASLLMTACQKSDNKKPGRGDDDDDDSFVSLIKIDGDFSDWDALTSGVVTATCDPKSAKTALSSMKVYADEMYISVLFTFDEKQITDKAWVPFHIYFDVDNSDATGGYGDEFTDANVDFMVEGAVFADGAYVSYDPSFWKWWGEPGTDGWLWTEHSVNPAVPEPTGDGDNWGALIGEGNGIGTGAGKGNTYELQILREMLTGASFADTFGIGIDIQQNWDSVGILPNAEITDTNTKGIAPKLKVTIQK